MATLDFNQYRVKLAALLNNLPAEISAANQGIAQSTIQLIRGRLINDGIDGEGKPLGKYSTTPLPTFFFKGVASGSGADKKLEALIKRKQKSDGKAYKGISYEEFRALNNLPTDHVTLSFTGETLADIGVVDTRTEGQIIHTTIGALGQKSKAKYNAKGEKVGQNSTEKILDYLCEKYGENILAANEDEQRILAEAFDSDLQTIIDRYLEV